MSNSQLNPVQIQLQINLKFYNVSNLVSGFHWGKDITNNL